MTIRSDKKGTETETRTQRQEERAIREKRLRHAGGGR